jgi:hypothetical protein
MKRLLLSGLFIGFLASNVMAEPATVNWTEPTASGTLASTTVYWCLGTNCVDWKTGPEFKRTSDNGNGGDAKSLTFIVPLVQGSLPVILRVKVTATDTNNNETSGVIVSHTFSN